MIDRLEHTMYEIDSCLFEIPSVEKTPNKYDDRIPDMGEFYKKKIEEQLRENDNLRVQGLQQLRDWIAKHPHIRKCRTDSQFLLRFLRSKKYSINNATETLERYLVCRALHPAWFTLLDIEDPDINALFEAGYLFPMLERDSKGRTLIFNETAQMDPTRFTAAHVVRLHALIIESLSDMPEVQCAGLVVIYDVSGLTLAQLSLVSLREIKLLAQHLSKAMAISFQEMHFVNAPGAALTIANFALQMLSDKMRERVFCHRNWEELYAKVDRNLLPKEFGGKTPKAECISAGRLHMQKIRNRLLNNDNMEIEITKDSKYWQEANDTELETGAIGSFRQLAVD
ncbi:clavesin-2-like [Topomyia yanbarensis]|uniref:clavesin-2-like n=1 Tax=Topomyia yanbarensis TaxID=2498891 RepID=UPI00273B5269|nr:clavesin-2-like [Topomyia yanbarensis]